MSQSTYSDSPIKKIPTSKDIFIVSKTSFLQMMSNHSLVNVDFNEITSTKVEEWSGYTSDWKYF